MIANNVRDLVGNTPLYEITSFDLPAGTRILAKLEWMNPGGSVKDRLGIQLVDAAIENGHVTPGGTIIEPTAGNTGIGLALAAKKYDLQVICVVPEKFSQEKQTLMRALGATVVNTPTVTFANAVTQVGMSQANLTAQLLGLGGATADDYNRLSVNTPAVLLNNAGAGVEATVNKAGTGNDAAFAFKTGFSARALIGLLGNDDFSFKVSPDGSAFFDAIRIDRTSGQLELPQPTVLPGLSATPSPPPAGKASVYARSRAGAPWIDVMRPSGRDFPLQPHFGVNRIANWSPSTGTTVTTEGLPITSVGTVSTPTLAATNLATSMRRWRLTSAAVVDSVADQRSAGWACWRGNAAGLGGWTFVTRISLTTLQATGMGFFGLYGSTAALATTLTLAAAINCIGIGFQRGTHANWQLVANDGTGAPTLTDLGAAFAIATGGVVTLFIAAPPNGSSVWVRTVNEVTGAIFEQEITADLPAATQFLSPRLFLNTGATAAAVAYDCAGVYVEMDF